MFIEKDGRLYLTRGQDADMSVEITDAAGFSTEIVGSDVITLTVKDKPGGNVIFTASNNIVGEPSTIEISGSLTRSKAPGHYSADIRLERGGKKYTLWPVYPFDGVGNMRNFIILPEVTE